MQASDGARRFRVLRELGAGGMGTVALVEDSVRGQRVALKRLHAASSRTVRALKHEFRAVESLRHPHIVSPYELGEDEAGLYLLMELVEGVDLFTYCHGDDGDARDSAPTRIETLLEARVVRDAARPRALVPPALLTLVGSQAPGSAGLEPHTAAAPLSSAGLSRLERALPQLLSALGHLHARGLVHRDLKPENVLVEAEGALKLVDFGILSEHNVEGSGLVGTVAYLSPEAIRGGPPRPESDLYGLGVVLYELVTGRLPFWETDTDGMLLQHLHSQPMPVASRHPGCPTWLAESIDRLLAKDPEARPTLRELGARFPHELVVEGAGEAALLVGRAAERADLGSVLAHVRGGGFRFVTLGGASGVGKTALLEWLEREARRVGVVRFRARARVSERVPFNAVDGLIDGLSAHLEPGHEAYLDVLVERAASAFAVLATPSQVRVPVHPTVAFDAVVQLFSEVGKQRGLVLLCDDLQWADADSVALLARLCLLRPAHVALVATVREDSHSAPFARFWQRAQPDLHLALAPLPEAELAELVAACLEPEAAANGEPHVDVRDVARACQGSPLLARLSGRMLARGVWNRADAKDPLVRLLAELLSEPASRARQACALLVAVDSEIALTRLARLCGESLGSVAEGLAPLLHHQLVRAHGAFGPERRYDLAHDHVRRALADLLSASELTRAHRQLADELERTGERRAERVRHLVGAGAHAEAGRLAFEGAREAEAACAYGLAAELYAVAVLHGPARAHDAAHRARARCLEHSGRYLEAASAWSILAEQSTGEARLDALLHEAKALLATSHLSLGRRALNEAREAQGGSAWSRSPLARAFAVLRFLRGPGRERIAPSLDHTREASDRDAFLGTMVGYFDPPAGLWHLLAARDGYVRAGHAREAAEVDYVLAYVAYFGAARDRKTSLAERYTKSAETRLFGKPGPELGRPHALSLMVQGVRAQHRGAFAEAEKCLESSIEAYERLGLRGSFEHQFSWVQRLQVARHRQNVPLFARTLEAFARVAQEVEDSALSCHLGFHETAHELVRGRPERALERARETERAWPADEPSYQRFLARFYVALPQIYLGGASAALVALERALREHARFFPLRTMFAGDVLSVRAMLESQALVAGVPGASLSRILRLARRAQNAPPLGRHMGLRAAGQALAHAGNLREAERKFRRAESLALGVGQHIDVALSRFGRGLTVGGSDGDALCVSARALLEECGADARLFAELTFTRPR